MQRKKKHDRIFQVYKCYDPPFFPIYDCMQWYNNPFLFFFFFLFFFHLLFISSGIILLLLFYIAAYNPCLTSEDCRGEEYCRLHQVANCTSNYCSCVNIEYVSRIFPFFLLIVLSFVTFDEINCIFLVIS